MPSIRVEAQLSLEQLLKAVAQMPPAEYERFIVQASRLRAKPRARKLTRAESALLLKINQGLPPELQRRYQQLLAKRRRNKLTNTEYVELLHINDQAEKLNAKRIKHLAALARMRKKPLTVVMAELGIEPPAYE